MSKKVSFEITVDARGAVEGVKKADASVKDLDKSLKSVEKDAEKVAKAKADMGKASAEASNLMSQGLKAVGIDTTRFTAAMQTADRVKKASTLSTRALTFALLALPFVAIAAAAMVLFKAFSSTQEGADRLNRVIEPLRFTMQALWGLVQDLSLALSDRLVKAFQDPRQAIRDLGDLLVSQVTNRINGILEAFGALGRGIQALITRDFTALREETRNFGNAWLQTATGIEDAGAKIIGVIGTIRETIDEGVESGRRLAELRVQIEELSNAQIISLAALRREYNEILNTSRDQTKSEQERLQALRDSQTLARQIRDEQLALLELQIEEAQLRAAANDTNRETQAEINRLIAQRDELESQYQSTIRRTNTELTRIESQQREAFEARQLAIIEEFDLLMANFDAQEEREEEMHRQRLQMIRDEELAEEAANQKKIEDEAKAHRALVEMEAKRLGNILANDVARAKSIDDLGKRAMRSALNEILLRTFTSVIESLPFPANVFLAPIAAAGAGRAAQALVPGFRDGGLVPGGRRIIEVNETGGSEFVVNAEATRRNLPLLEAINRGGSLSGVASGGNSVRLDDGGLVQALSTLRFELDQRVLYASVKDELTRRKNTVISTNEFP